MRQRQPKVRFSALSPQRLPHTGPWIRSYNHHRHCSQDTLYCKDALFYIGNRTCKSHQLAYYWNRQLIPNFWGSNQKTHRRPSQWTIRGQPLGSLLRHRLACRPRWIGTPPSIQVAPCWHLSVPYSTGCSQSVSCLPTLRTSQSWAPDSWVGIQWDDVATVSRRDRGVMVLQVHRLKEYIIYITTLVNTK